MGNGAELTLYVANLAENAGYGFDKMVDGWLQYTGTAPEFTSDTSFTKSVFAKAEERTKYDLVPDDDEKVGEKVGENAFPYLTNNQSLIVALMAQYPTISAKKLAEEVGISLRKVEVNIKKLRDKEVIERIGPARGGYWKILS